jgi:hypothetical protein
VQERVAEPVEVQPLKAPAEPVVEPAVVQPSKAQAEQEAEQVVAAALTVASQVVSAVSLAPLLVEVEEQASLPQALPWALLSSSQSSQSSMP